MYLEKKEWINNNEIRELGVASGENAKDLLKCSEDEDLSENKILETIKKEILKAEIEDKLEKNIVDQSVYDYLNELVRDEKILEVIIKYDSKFADTLSKCEEDLIDRILWSIQNSIKETFYYKELEIIGNTVYRLFFNISNYRLKKKIKYILQDCVDKGSYHCESLYDEIKIKLD